MKCRINKIVFICIIFFACMSLFPRIVTYAAEKEEREIVRVGYYPIEGYYEKDENGVLSGYGYEVLQMISGYAGFEYEYSGYDKTWNEILDMLDNGEVDMLTSVQYNEERAEKYDYSNFPIGYSEAVLTTTENHSELNSGDYSSYDGMRVGMMTGSNLNEKMFAFAEIHHFSFEPVYYETQIELEEAIRNGSEVDAIVNSSMNILKEDCVLERFGRAPYYVIVKKGNVELMDKINDAIGKMDLYYPAWQADLYEKYYAVNNAHLYLNEKQRLYLEQLKDSGTVIHVIINPDLKPYSYFENDQAKGILVEYFNRICEIYDLKAEYVQLDTAEEYTNAVIDHTGEIILVPYYQRYEADTDGYDLTQYFMNASFCMIVRSGEKMDAEFAGKKIAVVTGMTSVEQAGRKVFQDSEIVFYPTTEACIKAVKTEEVDGTLLYDYTAYQQLNHNWNNEIEMHEIPDSSITFSIAVSKECDPMLYELMNYAIYMIPESELDEIALPTVLESNRNDESIWEYISHRPNVWKSVVGSIALLFIIISFMISKKRTEIQKEKRTKAEYKATHDPLTGVYNRQGYNEILTQYRNDNRPFAYIQIDVDDFKNINDTYGHAFGDEVLNVVAKELSDVFRADDFVFRFGGDEFAVILTNCKTDAWESISYKQRLLHLNVKQRLTQQIDVTLSIGVCWSEKGMTEKMVALADAALYQVKRNGRAGCCVYDQNGHVVFEKYTKDNH